MIENNLDIKRDWKNFKAAIAEQLSALADHLTGLVNENAPGNILRGSFLVQDLSTDEAPRMIVATPLEYGEYVEFGTEPHWAPIAPLLAWAENTAQVHLTSVDVSFASNAKTRKPQTISGKGHKLRGSAKDRAIQSFAYAVRAKIAQVGTKAQYFVQKSLEQMGLAFEVVRDSTGSSYTIDVSEYLQSKIEVIAKESGYAA